MDVCIDIGTTAIKTALCDTGRIADILTVEYPQYFDGKKSEQNAEDWWDAIRSSVKCLTAKHRDVEIGALCISSQSITFVPVDGRGNALRRAITWLDMRAEDETREIEGRFSEEYIYKVTGKRLLPAYTLPKLIWLKTHEPALFERAYKFLFPPDYIYGKLTGNIMTDYTVASGSMMFDIDRLCWSDEILGAFHIDKAKLPEVKCMGTIVGTVLPEAADELGIRKDTKIVLGGQDQKLAAIGAGIEAKTATVSLGTATAVSTLSPAADSAAFALDDTRKIYECVLPTTGAAIKWLKETLKFSTYAEMNAAAERAGNSGGIAFSPDFTQGAQVSGLSLGTNPGHIAYALYEGVARGISGFLSPDIERLILFGGGANSRILCKIIAEITGKRTVVAHTTETACLGAAIIAGQRR